MTEPTAEIRAAANKLRALATAAAHDDRTRWEVGHTLGSKSRVVDDYLTAFASPVVGLSVARWLELAANEIADGGGFAAGAVDGPMNDRDHNTWSAALAVARDINSPAA